jgi:hypothetical protein
MGPYRGFAGGVRGAPAVKIRAAIAAGADASAPIRGKRPIEWLMETYLRSGRFVESVRVMLDAGATLDDPLLEAMLLDDDEPREEIPIGVRIHSAARSFAAARLRGVQRCEVRAGAGGGGAVAAEGAGVGKRI